MKHLVINASNLAPVGGLTGLLGYPGAWRSCGRIERITVIAGREGVARAVRQRFPDISLLLYAQNQSPVRRFLTANMALGRVISQLHPDVVMSTQSGILHCPAPQLVHHRNLHRFRCCIIVTYTCSESRCGSPNRRRRWCSSSPRRWPPNAGAAIPLAACPGPGGLRAICRWRPKTHATSLGGTPGAVGSIYWQFEPACGLPIPYGRHGRGGETRARCASGLCRIRGES